MMAGDEGHGPFFDSLSLGDVFDQAPSVTLTDGSGRHPSRDRRRALPAGTRPRPVGARRRTRPLTSPSLAWDVAIGQSTLVTQRAIANLFYRGLRFLRLPAIGDTLTTRVEIVGLRPAEPKPDRPPRGLVVMRIATSDQQERPVLDFHRCALLPARQRRGDAAGRQPVAGRWRQRAGQITRRRSRTGISPRFAQRAGPVICVVCGRASGEPCPAISSAAHRSWRG